MPRYPMRPISIHGPLACADSCCPPGLAVAGFNVIPASCRCCRRCARSDVASSLVSIAAMLSAKDL